ncbi:mesencephalic astrocyte-derived neurotrophic factor homolog [Argonauta hians]
MKLISLVTALFTVCNLFSLRTVVAEGRCEVCIKEVEQFIKTVPSEDKSDFKKLNKHFREFCKGSKTKRERFCYYVGALETSATNIINEMTKPLSYSLPPNKVCEKLDKLDSQICDLKYEKMIDLAKTNLKKLKVKDLKKILTQWGEDGACKGCAEKSDFIKVIEDLMPTYAPEAHAARQNAEL